MTDGRVELEAWELADLFSWEIATVLQDWTVNASPFVLLVAGDREWGRSIFIDAFAERRWLAACTREWSPPEKTGIRGAVNRLLPSAAGKRPVLMRAELDLEVSEHQDKFSGLVQVRSQLGEFQRVPFPRFDVVFTELHSKLHSAADLKTKYPRIFSAEHNEWATELTDYLGGATIDALKMGSDFFPSPGAIFRSLTRARYSLRRRKDAKAAQADLEWIEKLSHEELRERLPEFLVRDIRAHQQSLATLDVPHSWTFSIDGVVGDRLPKWLAEIVSELPFINLIIGSDRDLKLPASLLEQDRMIDGIDLSPRGAADFEEHFDALGLNDVYLQRTIVRLSSGQPMRVKSLLSAVEAYLKECGCKADELTEVVPLIEHLEQVSRDHLEAQLHKFSMMQRKVIGMAALIPFLDEEIFVGAMDLFAFGTELQDWDTFCRVCGVTISDRRGYRHQTATIPDPLRSLAREYVVATDAFRVRRLLQWLASTADFNPGEAVNNCRLKALIRAGLAHLDLDPAMHTVWIVTQVDALLAAEEFEAAIDLLDNSDQSLSDPSAPKFDIRVRYALRGKVGLQQLPIAFDQVESDIEHALADPEDPDYESYYGNLDYLLDDQVCDITRAEAALHAYELLEYESVIISSPDPRKIFRNALESTLLDLAGQEADGSVEHAANILLARIRSGAADAKARKAFDLKLMFELCCLLRDVPWAGPYRGPRYPDIVLSGPPPEPEPPEVPEPVDWNAISRRFRAVRRLSVDLGIPPMSNPHILRAHAEIRFLKRQPRQAFELLNKRAQLPGTDRERVSRLLDIARRAARMGLSEDMFAATKQAVALSGPVVRENPELLLAVGARLEACRAFTTFGNHRYTYHLRWDIVKAIRSIPDHEKLYDQIGYLLADLVSNNKLLAKQLSAVDDDDYENQAASLDHDAQELEHFQYPLRTCRSLPPYETNKTPSVAAPDDESADDEFADLEMDFSITLDSLSNKTGT